MFAPECLYGAAPAADPPLPAAPSREPVPALPPALDITADDLVQLAHVLPESAQSLIRQLGTDAALALLTRWPGVQYPVPKHRSANASGAARWASLAAVVGEEAMPALTQHYGGGILVVPTCRALLVEKRDRWLRDRFDDLTDLAGPALPASAAVYELGLALAEAGQPMTYREIEKRLNRGDAASPPPQIDLFGGSA